MNKLKESCEEFKEFNKRIFISKRQFGDIEIYKINDKAKCVYSRHEPIKLSLIPMTLTSGGRVYKGYLPRFISVDFIKQMTEITQKEYKDICNLYKALNQLDKQGKSIIKNLNNKL